MLSERCVADGQRQFSAAANESKRRDVLLGRFSRVRGGALSPRLAFGDTMGRRAHFRLRLPIALC